MSEDDFKMLMEEFERLRRECDTPEKASAQLQKSGLLDANGKLPAKYGGEGEDAAWQ